MKEILILTVTALKEKLFIAFMLIVRNIIGEFEELNDKLSFYFDQFRAAYDNLNFVYLKYDLKWYTEKVQEADRQRIDAFKELRDTIRFNQTYPRTEAIGEAAKILLEVIDLYECSDIAKLKMNERTTAITNLVEDYEEKYLPQVEALAVGGLLETLKQQQAKFMEDYLARNDMDSELGLNAMAGARKRMTDAYRDLVTATNLLAKRDTEGELDGFIDRLNVEIRKNFVNTGQSASSVGSGTVDGSGSATSVFKNATFEFVGGNSQKFRLEVGAPLEALANTVGYKWKPEVMAFMPNRNIVFREVPIEDKEAIATFHFFDHTEEEIKQVVGSALTAPANMEGYYWDPEVPATMPEEDTSYYEMPVAAEEEPEYTIDYYNYDANRVLHTQTYRVGETIVPPEPPAGFGWSMLPAVMPARNLKIYPYDLETGE